MKDFRVFIDFSFICKMLRVYNKLQFAGDKNAFKKKNLKKNLTLL